MIFCLCVLALTGNIAISSGSNFLVRVDGTLMLDWAVTSYSISDHISPKVIALSAGIFNTSVRHVA